LAAAANRTRDVETDAQLAASRSPDAQRKDNSVTLTGSFTKARKMKKPRFGIS
jgi:hypothetical protein